MPEDAEMADAPVDAGEEVDAGAKASAEAGEDVDVDIEGAEGEEEEEEEEEETQRVRLVSRERDRRRIADDIIERMTSWEEQRQDEPLFEQLLTL